VKILLDECTPHVLKRLLTGFEIKTVQDQGWSGITNGALLRLAEGGFDVLITSDQNLRYQQNLAKRHLAIIQLPTNHVPLIKELAPQIQATLAIIKTGQFIALSLTKQD
jgi:predicted nuclease of predicted toxin-antitoxin system